MPQTCGPITHLGPAPTLSGRVGRTDFQSLVFHAKVRVLPTTPLVKFKVGRGTLYPLLGLPIEQELVETCVCCLLKDRRTALFLSSAVETESRARASLENPWVSHLIYASQVLQIRSLYLNPL